MFIKLTKWNNEKIYINVNAINYFNSSSEREVEYKTEIILNQRVVFVKETETEIYAAIKGELKKCQK